MLLFFDDPSCTNVGLAGGKGASLARMTALGMPVPPGFVVPASELEETLADTAAALREVLARGESGENLTAVADEAQALVHAADARGTLTEHIAAAYERLGGGDLPVAVRSSATAEDSEAASFAGQQETYLHVRGVAQIVERVRDCWGSFFTERALFYRREGLTPRPGDGGRRPAHGAARRLGRDVHHRPNPGSPRPHGRGSRVRARRGRPLRAADPRSLRPGARRAAQAHPSAHPAYAIVHDPAGGVRDQELPPERGQVQTLNQDELARLAKVGIDLEQRLGAPQDIEWAIEGHELFVSCSSRGR